MFLPCSVIFREKLSVIVTLRLHYTVKRECAVDCALRRLWRRELFVVLACTIRDYKELFDGSAVFISGCLEFLVVSLIVI
jgi:hypothetical protein